MAADMNNKAGGIQSRSISKPTSATSHSLLRSAFEGENPRKYPHYDRLEPKLGDVRTSNVSIGGPSRRASVDPLNKRSM